MLVSADLYKLAKCRYDEAKILLHNHKADGAVYLCGYALELILKQRIVKVLDWDGYPENNKEFEKYKSFRIHDLDILLHLSGLERKIKADNTVYANWQIASRWNSEIRYRTIGQISEQEARDTIDATKIVVNFILETLRML